MIIDIHTHTPTHRDKIPAQEVIVNRHWRPDRPVHATFTWKDFIDAMEPVDFAVVFGIAPPPGSSALEAVGIPWPHGINDMTAELVKKYPEKLIGFLSVHPEQRDALGEVERCVFDLGMKGIKLAPNYQRFDPTATDAVRVYEMANKLGLPIIFHQGTSPVRNAPLRYGHPLVMDEIATRFPELRIIMAHMGHPWFEDTITVLRKHPNVYADISGLFYRPWSFYNCLRLATEWGVLHKLLFGSDFPVSTPRETMESLVRVNDILRGSGLPPVPHEELTKIIHRDSLEILGIHV
jgi:predicted TIM-barrel fold metal-dependent hydrolase